MVCDAPISLVSLIDADRQWFKARVGLDPKQTDRDISFCAHAILHGELFIVPDATKDERFFDNPLVTGDPDIRFYAGVPLRSPRGGNMGTLCVLDRKPREMPEDKRKALIVLGKQVVKLMELRRMNADLKTLTLQENTQRQKLEEVSERQKKMISILAHDIRSPLSSLKSLLQLLPEQDQAEESRSLSAPLLKMAGNQVDDTLSLLDNIVDWATLQLSGSISRQSDFILRDIVSQTLTELQIQSSLKGLTLINSVAPAIRLVADENKVRFILRNLLTNAIKFTRSGTVSVKAALTETHVRFMVEDTGIGIPLPILEQLFQDGKKATRKGTQNEAGSGLGLSLVREFVAQMQGTVTVGSEVDKGTSITIELPRLS